MAVTAAGACTSREGVRAGGGGAGPVGVGVEKA